MIQVKFAVGGFNQKCGRNLDLEWSEFNLVMIMQCYRGDSCLRRNDGQRVQEWRRRVWG